MSNITLPNASIPTTGRPWQQLANQLGSYGLRLRGWFNVDTDTGVPALPGHINSMLVLVGQVGSEVWPVFSSSPEYHDGLPHPLDRWSQRLGDGFAAGWGGKAWYPFGGPPYLPFQRWADACETLEASPLGLRLHPSYGLWHAYRFALQLPALPTGVQALPQAVVSTNNALGATPSTLCSQCEGQPCLHTCPVDAFSTEGYNTEACLTHLNSGPAAKACNDHNCQARLACPVGVAFQYHPAHGAFHMRQFVVAHAKGG